ncbi:hypothetical protein GCM10020001_101540 [Nonomuraea salmonea]
MLDVRPADRVLEIGFGPGVAIAEFARRAGRVFGVDHSATMARQAARRNAAAVRAGRVRLVVASVERLPDFGGPLDVVLAVNSVGFWPDPVDRLRELRGLLRPGGRIALVSQPRCPGATRETTARAAQELQGLLAEAGFVGFRVETLELRPPVACVLAAAPGGEEAPGGEGQVGAHQAGRGGEVEAERPAEVVEAAGDAAVVKVEEVGGATE